MLKKVLKFLGWIIILGVPIGALISQQTEHGVGISILMGLGIAEVLYFTIINPLTAYYIRREELLTQGKGL